MVLSQTSVEGTLESKASTPNGVDVRRKTDVLRFSLQNFQPIKILKEENYNYWSYLLTSLVLDEVWLCGVVIVTGNIGPLLTALPSLPTQALVEL